MKQTDYPNTERNGKKDDDLKDWFTYFVERSHARLAPQRFFEKLPYQELERNSKDESRDANNLFVPGYGKAALVDKLSPNHWTEIRNAFASRLLRNRREKFDRPA